MPLRTPQQYLNSLRDGREVYILGERVEDVTAHPVLGLAVRHSAMDYELAEEQALRELTAARWEATGQEISRYFQIPRTAEDLLRRRDLIELGTKKGCGMVLFIKEIGSDCLYSLAMVADAMDRELKTEYAARVWSYWGHCAGNDLAMAGAVTDVKGNRALRPSQQAMPDYYVRIVDRNKDGIVVRGAKAHITSAPYVNELVVLPTRNMLEADRDYAVAFAVPANAQGLKMICKPEAARSDFDFPISSRHFHVEAMVILDDVFVPWERVFMAGEWQFAGALANTFATWHRFTALAYKGPLADLLLGAAQLIAEYNGVENASHIRDKISRLIAYAQTIRVFGKAAALECQKVAGIAYPNPLLTNIGKHYFADNYHDCVKMVQEIAGGLVVTAPAEKDYLNPATRGYIDKYLGAKEGISAADRLRLFKLIMDLTASEYAGLWLVVTLHGEGSLEAQRLAAYREFDLQSCTAFARQVANIRA